MKQLIPWGIDDAPSYNVAQYQTLGGNGEVPLWTSTENEVSLVVPTNGTLTDLNAEATTSAGAGKSMTLLVRKNGVDTGLSIVFSGSDVEKTSSTELAVQKGDLVCLKSTPSGTPNAQKFFGSISFVPDNANEIIFMGGTGDSPLGTAAKWLPFGAPANGATEELDVRNVITNVRGGVFGSAKKMIVSLQNEPDGSASRTFILYKNGEATAFSVTLSGEQTFAEISNSLDISDGDLLCVRATAANSPDSTKAYISFVAEPEIQGEYLLLGVSEFDLPTSGNNYEYNRICTGNSNWTLHKVDRAMGGADGHKIIGLGFKLEHSPSTLPDNKAYELYLENPSTQVERAYIEGLETYDKTAELNWDLARYQHWNVRTLGYNSPRPARASWCTQMKYTG